MGKSDEIADPSSQAGRGCHAPHTPPESRAGTLWSHDLEVPEKPQHRALLSVYADPFQPHAVRAPVSHLRPGPQTCLLKDTRAPTMCRV